MGCYSIWVIISTCLLLRPVVSGPLAHRQDMCVNQCINYYSWSDQSGGFPEAEAPCVWFVAEDIVTCFNCLLSAGQTRWSIVQSLLDQYLSRCESIGEGVGVWTLELSPTTSIVVQTQIQTQAQVVPVTSVRVVASASIVTSVVLATPRPQAATPTPTPTSGEGIPTAFPSAAPSTPSSRTTLSATPITHSEDANIPDIEPTVKKGPSTGTIVGAVIGGTVGACLFAACLWNLCCRANRTRRNSGLLAPPHTIETPLSVTPMSTFTQNPISPLVQPPAFYGTNVPLAGQPVPVASHLPYLLKVGTDDQAQLPVPAAPLAYTAKPDGDGTDAGDGHAMTKPASPPPVDASIIPASVPSPTRLSELDMERLAARVVSLLSPVSPAVELTDADTTSCPDAKSDPVASGNVAAPVALSATGAGG